MMKKAVIFDMDGVIFDSERLIADCWKKVADKYEIPHMEETCKACIGLDAALTKKKMLEIYGEDFLFDKYDEEMLQLFHVQVDLGLPIKSGVKDILSYLKEKNVMIALATSTSEKIVLKELTDAGLISFFKKIICGDMVKRGKPAPDIYQKACEELGVNPEEVYAVEDSFNGVRAAHGAGIQVLMVPDLAQPNEEIRQLTWQVFPSLVEVKEYFQSHFFHEPLAADGSL